MQRYDCLKRMWISYAICCLIFSCRNESNRDDKVFYFSNSSFPIEENLRSEKHVFETLLNPNKIYLKNSVLILSSKGGENLIHLIDKHEMKYLRSTGKKGEAPGEIRNSVWEFDSGLNDSTFWAYDLGGKTNYEFELYYPNTKAKRWIRQEKDFFLGLSMHWVNTNAILSQVTNSSHKFAIFDSTGRKTKEIGAWSFEKNVNPTQANLLTELYQGPIDYSVKKRILVSCSVRFDQFEILDLLRNRELQIRGPIGEDLNYTVESRGNQVGAFVDPETPLGYNDVFVGENSIFLVYIGKTDREISVSGELSRTIFQFDFEGNPLAHFKLDVPIKAITVSEKDRKIYAVTQDREPGIAVFNY